MWHLFLCLLWLDHCFRVIHSILVLIHMAGQFRYIFRLTRDRSAGFLKIYWSTMCTLYTIFLRTHTWLQILLVERLTDHIIKKGSQSFMIKLFVPENTMFFILDNCRWSTSRLYLRRLIYNWYSSLIANHSWSAINDRRAPDSCFISEVVYAHCWGVPY